MLSEALGMWYNHCFTVLMKTNPVSARKVALLLATICAVMLASVSQVRADRHPLPPTGVAVPDSGEQRCCWVPPLARSEWLGVFCASSDPRPARLNQKTGQAFGLSGFLFRGECRIHWATRYGVTATTAQIPNCREFLNNLPLCCKLSIPRCLLALPFTRAFINVGGIYGLSSGPAYGTLRL